MYNKYCLKKLYKFRHRDECFGLDVENILFFKMNKMTWDVIEAFPDYDRLNPPYNSSQLKSTLDALIKNKIITSGPPVSSPAAQITGRSIPLTGLGLCFGNWEKGEEMPLHLIRDSIDFLVEESAEQDDIHLVFIPGNINLDKSLAAIKESIVYSNLIGKRCNKNFTYILRTETLFLSPRSVRFLVSHDLLIEIVFIPDPGMAEIDLCGVLSEDVILDLRHKYGPVTNNAVINLSTGRETVSNLGNIMDNLGKIGFNMVFMDMLCPRCRGSWENPGIDPSLVAQAIKENSIEFEEREGGLKGLINIIPLMHSVMTSEKIRSGCGAGLKYVVVNPRGDIYPCHYLVSGSRYKLGNISSIRDHPLQRDRLFLPVETKEVCCECGVRYLCGGGSNFGTNSIDPFDCKINRELAEYALIKYSGLDLKKKTWITAINNRMETIMPYRRLSVSAPQPEKKDRLLQVNGSSMRPFVKEGDRVIVRPFDDVEKVKIGDIVCFGKPVTCHRVIRKARIDDRLYIWEKGDRQVGGSRIPAAEITGKVVAIQKDSGMIRIDNIWGVSINRLMAFVSSVAYTVHNMTGKRRRKSG